MKIMIIENDPESIECFIACLKKVDEKIKYIAFDQSNLVIEYARKHTADMLFTEVKLREMTGFALINQVKQIQPAIYSVILAKTTEYALEAWSNHVDDYITISSLDQYLGSCIEYMKYHRLRR